MTSGSSDPAPSEDSLKAVPGEPIRISQRPTSDYGAVRGSLPSEQTHAIHNGRGHRAGKLLQRPGKVSEMIVALWLFGPRTRLVVPIACIVRRARPFPLESTDRHPPHRIEMASHEQRVRRIQGGRFSLDSRYEPRRRVGNHYSNCCRS